MSGRYSPDDERITVACHTSRWGGAYEDYEPMADGRTFTFPTSTDAGAGYTIGLDRQREGALQKGLLQ